MTLWWLQPGWRQTSCARCGAKIWPEGDPDWGYCYSCFSDNLAKEHNSSNNNKCEICNKYESVTNTCGKAVCSLECSLEAEKQYGIEEK